MKKKFILCLALLLLSATLVCLLVSPISAATSGNYTYEVVDGGATITKCDLGFGALWQTSISIPSELGGYPVTGIGASAFSGLSRIKTITIPGSVTSIGASAFANCSSLTSLTVPSSVTSIGSGAFSGCSKLKSITLPFVGANKDGSGAAHFGYVFGASDASANQSSLPSTLKTVTITGGAKIGGGAFSGCAGLTSITITGSATSIGDSAFLDCTGLTSVAIPDTVESIGVSAFSGCTALKGITLPGALSDIGDSAFQGCVGLTGITIPPSVANIGSGAFSGCTGLTSAVVSDSVKLIGVRAFAGCTGLTSITIPFVGEKMDRGEKTNFGHIFGASTPDTNREYVPSSLKTVVITGGEHIASSAFLGCDGITSITLPSTLKTIGDKAFLDCSSLAGIAIPGGATSIGDKAFYGCTALVRIELPDSVTSIGDYAFHNTGYSYDEDNWENGVLYIGNYLCQAKKTLSGACAVKNGTVSVLGYAFEDCAGLTSITFPDSLTSIGYSAFSGCTGLTSLTIPASVTRIGYYAFYGCTGLTSITVKTGNPVFHSAGNCLIQTATRTVIQGSNTGVIPTDGSVKTIGDYAFAGLAGLTGVTLSDGVTSVGEHAFEGCDGLASLVIADTVTNIGNRAFSGCSSLTGAALPDDLKRIGSYAFYGCAKIASIAVPATVTHIGEFAFAGCTGLTSLTVETGNTVYHSDGNCLIETAKRTLLGGCNASVIPTDGSVTSIGDYAFYYCARLTSLTIPDCVTSIGKHAFGGCAGLMSITVENGNPNYHSDGNCLIETATGILLQGSNTGVIPTDGSVTVIGDYAFTGCYGLTSITIPDCVTSIGKYAFAGCVSLTSITVEDGNPNYHSDGNCLIETETATLIVGCKNSVIPDDGSVTSIGAYAFVGGAALESIEVPACVTSVDERAFYYYPGLDEWLEANHVSLYASNLFLDGTIGLNFYFHLGDGVLARENAVVHFTLADGRIIDIPVSEGRATSISGTTYYMFSCELYAKQMADVVRVQVMDGETALGTEYSHSVVGYATKLLALAETTPQYAAAKPLIEAMLHYGAYAQLHFGYNVDALANANIDPVDLSDVTADTFKDYQATGMEISGIGRFISSNLVLESETTLNLYFLPDEGVDASAITFKVDDRVVTPTTYGQYLVITITDIKADELDDLFTVTVLSGKAQGSFTASVYAYCRSTLLDVHNIYNDAFKNALRALYKYNAAANAYFD